MNSKELRDKARMAQILFGRDGPDPEALDTEDLADNLAFVAERSLAAMRALDGGDLETAAHIFEEPTREAEQVWDELQVRAGWKERFE